MKFALIGAFDRNNYGDLLMPIVVTKKLERKYKDCKIDYYGLIDSKMNYCGGFDTKKLSDMYNNEYDAIIIDGGDILSVTWSDMYLNLLDSRIKIFAFKCIRKISYRLSDILAKKILKGKSERPWILDKNKIKCKQLIYNTVDGTIENTRIHKEILKENIKNIDYISLRNSICFDEISSINNNAYMYPDSVLGLSKYISIEELEKNISGEVKKFTQNNKYFVFQSKKNIGKKYYEDIKKNIEAITTETNLKCLLLPIGYAQGHEDQIILKQIMDNMDSDNVVMFEFSNIYEIIYLIKNSEFFIGTSLHGLITSISYGVPHMAFTDQIKKQINFLNTWNTTPIIYTDAQNMEDNVKKLLENIEESKQLVNQKKDELIALVEENFNKIDVVIDNE